MLPDLHTMRLTLRPATSSDLDMLWSLWIDPDVRRFLFDDIAVPRERAGEILNDCLLLRDVGLGLWVIDSKEHGTAIGFVGLMPATTVAELEPSLAGAIEPLIGLRPGVHGQGYATEALTAAVEYAFGPRALPWLGAAVDLPNHASHRLVERLGFETIGECDGPRYRLRTYRLTPAGFAGRATR